LDVKLGLPVGDFLPYIKRGYGYNMVPQEKVFPSVTQKRPSGAIGIEYNFANRWSVTAEYKVSNFSNRDDSIKIYTKILSFGLTYYFDIPRVKKAKTETTEVELVVPEATIAPDAVPDAPPPP
jgi:opacity protein-like surface antigen